MRYQIPHWLPGYENDPRYIALSGQIQELATEIAEALQPHDGIRRLEKSRALMRKRETLIHDIETLKSQFLVTREVEVADIVGPIV
jgi:hypothetical protein